ncbi:hypothetical protein SAMD00079811_38150 [Scytonema sp. HK-05]|nr:hypothetical protein SAMD00079811_38150 [Scytonema sp. HK-05]
MLQESTVTVEHLYPEITSIVAKYLSRLQLALYFIKLL